RLRAAEQSALLMGSSETCECCKQTKSAGSTDSAYPLHTEQVALRQNLTECGPRWHGLLQFVRRQRVATLLILRSMRHFFAQTVVEFCGIGETGAVAT
ncbi:MAG: hypothetical protein ACK48R_14880, partial [Planctomyces sp.]